MDGRGPVSAVAVHLQEGTVWLAVQAGCKETRNALRTLVQEGHMDSAGAFGWPPNAFAGLRTRVSLSRPPSHCPELHLSVVERTVREVDVTIIEGQEVVLERELAAWSFVDFAAGRDPLQEDEDPDVSVPM